MGVAREDIEWNEDGEMIGYKGEGKMILLSNFLGFLFGVLITHLVFM